MKIGKFIDFYLPYKNQDGKYITNQDQAQEILQRTQILIKNGSRGIGIIYSANYSQTITIRNTYKHGKYKTGIGGSNQAAVIHQMESLLDNRQFQSLQGKIQIAPITTMTYSDYGGKTHIEVVIDDLNQIEEMLKDGWDILGWQNQTTINNNEYAIGGGVTQLTKEIKQKIQDTLHNFACKYKA